ncbi:MAG: deoxyribonuclease IV [Deltaproteobacteria bacterium CG11_big_fil_rev_8_21_14_0_20_49_13]|nr:MAG: deoxyribonuclease IV [Deltaproteobacteria bacterium CG11_big_fil_rev_8_21_14_0_20_49_13]
MSRLVGAHFSISGGLFEAARRAGALHCNTIQIFTKNSNQWEATPLLEADIVRFQNECSAQGVRLAFSHTGYLINLATAEDGVHGLSMRSMMQELKRAESLELPFIVVHPGSHKGAGEIVGIVQVVESLKELIDDTEGFRVKIALETTAGQGRSMGYKFEHFDEIFKRLPAKYMKRIGVCMDTAHIFAAGYDIRDKKGYVATMKSFDDLIGIENLLAIHLNDSAKDLGSRVDRHENLGKGYIGLDAFTMLLRDKRFFNVPFVLETPKVDNDANDKKNLRIIRKIVGDI